MSANYLQGIEMENYILVDDKPVAEPDILKWAQWFGEKGSESQMRFTVGDVRVSTCFLGIDHGTDPENPILWETMIFGGEHDGYQERCCTIEEARKMHAVAVEMV